MGMSKEEAKAFLTDVSYDLGTIGIEDLTVKDGQKMRDAIETLWQEPTTKNDLGVNYISRAQTQTEIVMKEKCPICKYEFEDCQCRFAGSAHPDRNKRARVVADHIYLFTDKQIDHLKKIQKWWSISYDDKEMNQILKELKSEVDNGNDD